MYSKTVFKEFKARFLYLASLTSHTTISTHLLNTLLLAKASFLGRHPNVDLKTSSNDKFTNLKLWQSSITLTDYKKSIPYLSFLSGFLSQVLVLGVTFPDKLEKFCCSHHLSYDTPKHYSSSASLLQLPHLLLHGSVSDSPFLTPFSWCPRYHHRPSLAVPHHPGALLKCGLHT